MDRIYFSSFFLFLASLFSINANSQEWDSIKQESCVIYFNSQDSAYIKEYAEFINNGISLAEAYFEKPFIQKFDIYIHPNRASLDIQWQTDWQMPEFKSECWMVASGISTRMDILSPSSWEVEACEHSFENKTKTQNLITHELVHIYHGQNNVSPDFFETYGINWFIEGLATYISGQCDSTRITDVKKVLGEGNIPESLDEFWSGNLRYGLSGTMVMFIDQKYGKEKLIQSLKYNKLENILNLLGTSESTLINAWAEYIQAYTISK